MYLSLSPNAEVSIYSYIPYVSVTYCVLSRAFPRRSLQLHVKQVHR